jgi:hypothetical protein
MSSSFDFIRLRYRRPGLLINNSIYQLCNEDAIDDVDMLDRLVYLNELINLPTFNPLDPAIHA